MCGRFSYWDSAHTQKRYHCHSSFPTEAHYNATPQSYIPVVVTHIAESKEGDGHPPVLTRYIQAMKWGFIPEWAHSESHQGFINARAETVYQKKSFKLSFKTKRCAIPARGFYEWDATKQPYFISNHTQELCFAGIWSAGNGGAIPSFAIITRKSHALSEIHDRCPAILQTQEDIAAWLSPLTREKTLLHILSHTNDADLLPHTVRREVNNPKNNYETLIHPI